LAQSSIALAMGSARAEAGLKQWEEKKTPSNAMAAIIALIGLGAIDVIFLLPLLMGVLATLE
ncbi:hypothetical protein, partial [Klebsiella aerogenes]|uniref:hypothetical protein n=1 Tax=Klebsiella aerogenes TaxID=548 RepID=UPI0019542977